MSRSLSDSVITLHSTAAPVQEAVPPAARPFDSRDLERLFRHAFHAEFDTVLCGGGDEPVYLAGSPARIIYTRDYFRSALHEVAHWCVAGAARRGQDDYGYWYAPDGRDAAQQRLFEQVEVAPQALELLFCAACGHRFRVSVDNLDGGAADERVFREAVLAAALARLGTMNPASQRWARWLVVLSDFYRGGAAVTAAAVQAVLR